LELLQRRLIAAASAKHVDLDAICWLISSPIGRLMRAHHNHARRELPVYLALPAPAVPACDLDRIMVRSRLDVLLKTPEGFQVIDYKTDRVVPEMLPARIKFYDQQMSIYHQ